MRDARRLLEELKAEMDRDIDRLFFGDPSRPAQPFLGLEPRYPPADFRPMSDEEEEAFLRTLPSPILPWTVTVGREDEIRHMGNEVALGPRCSICGRKLNVATDPKSLDCGGDCLACIEEAEGRA